jgi:hypothetical protein
MTVLEEFYKVGPGPSSSHTIGPMRITYDFYQRCRKLPSDQLAQATGMKVHLAWPWHTIRLDFNHSSTESLGPDLLLEGNRSCCENELA